MLSLLLSLLAQLCVENFQEHRLFQWASSTMMMLVSMLRARLCITLVWRLWNAPQHPIQGNHIFYLRVPGPGSPPCKLAFVKMSSHGSHLSGANSASHSEATRRQWPAVDDCLHLSKHIKCRASLGHSAKLGVSHASIQRVNKHDTPSTTAALPKLFSHYCIFIGIVRH